MQKLKNNYAFIDAQNLYRGIKSLGWKLNFFKFRKYLKEKYSITVAYLFIGFIPENQNLYTSFQKSGFIVILKPTILDRSGNIKGNVDADLVLHTMIDFDKFDKAIIISSDGDFYSLVAHLNENNKLKLVMSPYHKTCSVLLRKAAKEKIVFMDNLRQKLEHK